MKVLVTGASGFVGSTLCDELSKRGHEVKALMRKTSLVTNLTMAKLETVTGSLGDPDSLAEAVKDVEVIFHVAGVVAALTTKDFFRANAEGTKNLIEAAKKNSPGLKRFVYVSSLAAAGPSLADKPHLEHFSALPVSDYGASKLAGENEALKGRDTFPVVVVRPPAVYGPRDRGVLTFFQAVRRGILPLLGTANPDPRRYSFVHVEDLVQGIILAGFEAGAESGDIFYVTGDGYFSWEEAMRLIAQGLGQKTFTLRLPVPALKGAAAVCTAVSKITGKVLPFSLDKIKEIEAAAWTCSNEKAKKKLGFTPYWTLERGFAQTARWYRENGWL